LAERSLNGFIGFELHELLHGWSKAIAWLWLRCGRSEILGGSVHSEANQRGCNGGLSSLHRFLRPMWPS
jgi:hypothetical protein